MAAWSENSSEEIMERDLDVKVAEVLGYRCPDNDWFKKIPHKVAEQRGDDYLTPADFLPHFSSKEKHVVFLLEKIRTMTGKCVLLEASTNPEEYLCTVGWHYRGHWFKDFQVSAETAPLVVCLAVLEGVKL